MDYYPVNDFGPLMKGMVIGGVGIVHVFLAQFAIGGGMLLWYFERIGQKGREQDARAFVDSYFQILVLVSFVLGALTGVAMWFTTIQVGARTIGMMIDEFHWLWAAEWVCFSVEVCAGYAFYRFGKRLDDRTRLRMLALYALAAWASLFWIDGILSWQLTPGSGAGVWAGFFNPSFWPSLLYRTCVAMALAALSACVVVNTLEMERARRAALILRTARFAAPIAIMPVLALWYLAVIPADSRSWLLGGSIAMTMFVGIAAGSSVLIAGYLIFGLIVKRLYINGATATLLLALAFGATAAGEFVREGARKPYTIRGVLYSNSVRPADVAHLRQVGATAEDPYPLRDEARYPSAQLIRGAKVERVLCDACHTMKGANALVELARTWTDDQLRLNIAKLQRTKAFMPPFAGNADDVEALVQLIRWELAGAPATWPETAAPPEIARWLDEVGDAMILPLYLATLALHAVFVSYVVAGSAYALVRRDAVAATVRDRLPFMLGCGITAGVAPLLFVQLLHQHRFYTANLLLGPRWLAVVPALVVGFYMLYLAKVSERRRRPALAIGLVCFAFVAWSWSELHELMQADPEWHAFYAAGHRVFLAASIAPRLIVIAGAMATAFATLAAWSADAAARNQLALIALGGRIVSTGGAAWLAHSGFSASGAEAWLYVLVAAAAIECGAWIFVRVKGRGLAVATAAGSGAMVAAVVVREAPRLALIEQPHALADGAGGAVVFAVLAVAGVAAIAWIVRVVSSASTR